MTAMGKITAKPLFLDLVREMVDQNRSVSASNKAGNYAPRESSAVQAGCRIKNCESASNFDRTIINI